MTLNNFRCWKYKALHTVDLNSMKHFYVSNETQSTTQNTFGG